VVNIPHCVAASARHGWHLAQLGHAVVAGSDRRRNHVRRHSQMKEAARHIDGWLPHSYTPTPF
jgi:hypothetical protein